MPKTLEIELSDRFLEAAREWGDSRLTDETTAVEQKVEQALLEIEHLVSGARNVAFAVDDEAKTVRYEPTADLAALLERQAETRGLEPAAVLEMHVDLFARAFLEETEQAPEV
ncbi:hypothetical protein [Halopiger xanaduensis]|uniref:Uncharacterized protein n=1 Tax=Halopiger xanaduensis (strain DSM 18323 / JCM 14033 / SH-6) TaxID=797210 RepID=F8DBS0_HALXS|nr:hypothetical protein [Halopiger xanaduensis]AEH38346.1 hypothetical protein Halxa_3740 [Halopiger xanaduensis SH-6]